MILKLLVNEEELGKLIVFCLKNQIAQKDAPKKILREDLPELRQSSNNADNIWSVTLEMTDYIPRQNIDELLDLTGLFPLDEDHPTSDSFNIYKDIAKMLGYGFDGESQSSFVKIPTENIFGEKTAEAIKNIFQTEKMNLSTYRGKALEIIWELLSYLRSKQLSA